MKLKELFEVEFKGIDDKLPEQQAGEQVIASAQSAAELFNNSLATMFGSDHFVINARVTKILGPVLVLEFYDKYAKVTKHNSPVNLNFIMGLTGDKGEFKKEFEIEMTTLGYQLKKAGLKFRKIKARTPLDAVKKLDEWFKKNHDLILKVFQDNVKL